MYEACIISPRQRIEPWRRFKFMEYRCSIMFSNRERTWSASKLTKLNNACEKDIERNILILICEKQKLYIITNLG